MIAAQNNRFNEQIENSALVGAFNVFIGYISLLFPAEKKEILESLMSLSLAIFWNFRNMQI